MPGQKGERGYPAGFYHRALHRSPNDLLILFGGKETDERQHKRTSSKKLRDVPMWPPTVSSYLENLNYATVIKAPFSRLRPGRRGRTRKSSGTNERSRWVPREGREFLRKESRGAFPRDEADDSFFFSITPPSVPPCLSFSLVLSLAAFSPRPWVTPTLGDIS